MPIKPQPQSLLPFLKRGLLTIFLLLLPLAWFAWHLRLTQDTQYGRWKEAYAMLLYRSDLHQLIDQLWLESQAKGNENRVQESFKQLFQWELSLISQRYSKMPTTNQFLMPVYEQWLNSKDKSYFWDQQQKNAAYQNLMKPLLTQLEAVDALAVLDDGRLVESFLFLQESDPLKLLKKARASPLGEELLMEGNSISSNLTTLLRFKAESIDDSISRITPVPKHNPLNEQFVQSLNFYAKAVERAAELLDKTPISERSKLFINLWPTLLPSWGHAEDILLRWVEEEILTYKQEWSYILWSTISLLALGLITVYFLWSTIYVRVRTLIRHLEQNVEYGRSHLFSDEPEDEVGYMGKLLNALSEKNEAVREHSAVLVEYLKSSSADFIETATLQRKNLIEQEQIAKQVGLAAEEISAQTTELIISTANLSAVIQEAASLAQGERTELSELENVIGRLLKASREIEQLLQRLNQETLGVFSETSSLITLTDQSYLLALNTSIEASRGLESGSGFSVIAQEIHRLADQAAAVTLEIEGRFKNMTHTFISHSQQIEGFTIDISAGEVHSARVRDRMAQLLDKVQIIDGTFERMQRGVQQQVADAEAIGKMAITLTQVTQQALKLLHQLQENTQQFSAKLRQLHEGE